MAAGGWSNVRDALGDAGANQREDDAASRASTFSRVSYRPSVHSQQRGEEREISDDEIKQAKVSGRVSLAVRFDDDYGEQQARTKALEWGGQLIADLPLSLGNTKAKGRPGDRRIEVELVGSKHSARDVKRWLVDNGYFSDPNRVLYILQPSPREEIVVVEGLLAGGHVGVVTVFRRDDNGRELRSTTAAIILYCGVFSQLLKANADGQALVSVKRDLVSVKRDPGVGYCHSGPRGSVPRNLVSRPRAPPVELASKQAISPCGGSHGLRGNRGAFDLSLWL